MGLVALLLLISSLFAGPGAHARSAARRVATVRLPSAAPADRPYLVAELDHAQAVLDDRSSSAAELASAGRLEQLSAVALEREPAAMRRTILARLTPQARAAMRADLSAAAALGRLNAPRSALPPWRIVQPPPPATLLAYFKRAQAQFGVGWEYLAAIEFVETKFGRVDGRSTAGARGPMQFLPSTWARYGRGDVRNPHDAILGAARYLVAGGARHDTAEALYAYNPSGDYVRAIDAYAERMRSDPRAYYGYYYWQVLYAKRGGLVILPVGYPKAQPLRVH